jgi:hypothetical protein
MNNNKFINNIRVFTALQVSKEWSYFSISSKDSFNKVVVSKQAFFGRRSAFPVLKSCRILHRFFNHPTAFPVPKSCRTLRRRHTNNDKDIDDDKDMERKIDPMDKMMSNTTSPTTTDGNQDVIANLPTTLVQGNNNGSTLSATATVHASNSNTTKQAWMSYNIKLLLTSKQDTSDSALQHAMNDPRNN